MRKTVFTYTVSRSLLLALSLVTLIAHPVFADIDRQYYSANDIRFYNPEAQICVNNSLTNQYVSSGNVVSADVNKRAEIILQYFTGRGLTLAAASGIVGNMLTENSTLNPSVSQGGATNLPMTPGVGYGLVQWTTASRQKQLTELSNNTGKPVNSMDVQLNMVWYELTHSWKSTLRALSKQGLTPVDAAIVVHGWTEKVASSGDSRFINAPKPGYEASGDTASHVIEKRGGDATMMYEKFKGSIQDGSGVAGVLSTDGATVSTTDLCSSSNGTAATKDCPVTAPITGEGGNGTQLSKDQLIALYGEPEPSSMSKKMVAVNFLGKQITINPLAAGCLIAVSDELQQKNISYTIKEIGGYRYDSNNGKSNIGEKSYHTYGVAVDINWSTNPFISGGTAAHDMPQAYIDAFHHHGWSWGGNWRSVKDYMHFEFNGLSPK